MKTAEVSLKNRLLRPETVFSDSLTATISCHNPRFKALEAAELANVNYDRILEMAKEQTSNAAAFTFTIIGNYDEATIRPLIEQYLAALPSKKEVVKSGDVSTDFKGVVVNSFKQKAETPKAIAVMVWYTKDLPFTLENSIKTDMVGQILDMVYTKEIREEASAAYTVFVMSSMSRNDFENEAQLLIYCDADKLQKVKEYMLKSHADQLKQNNYWMGSINNWRKWGIDFHTDYEKVVNAQTPESISAFVAEMLKAGNRAEIIMMPAE